MENINLKLEIENVSEEQLHEGTLKRLLSYIGRCQLFIDIKRGCVHRPLQYTHRQLLRKRSNLISISEKESFIVRISRMTISFLNCSFISSTGPPLCVSERERGGNLSIEQSEESPSLAYRRPTYQNV